MLARRWFHRWPVFIKKGGPGSGHHGHKGSPGRGGSLPTKGVSLTSAEETAIGLYTGTAYGAINDGLRAGRELGERNKEIVAGIDSAISKSSLVEDRVLYRGVPQGISAETSPLGGVRRKVGVEFEDKGYPSTSTSLKTASTAGRKAAGEGEAVYLYEIRMKAGQKALDAGKYSEWGAEGEFILPRGTMYKIVDIDYDYAGGREDILYMKLEVL